jgi:thioredoxin 1
VSDNIVQVTDASYEHEVLGADRPVIVDFWAPWCGPCRVMNQVFEELAAQHHHDVKFAKVNVDENPATQARYEILSIPTVLVVAGGEVQKKLLGGMPKGRLVRELSAWLEPQAA